MVMTEYECPRCGNVVAVSSKTATVVHGQCPNREPRKAAPVYVKKEG